MDAQAELDRLLAGAGDGFGVDAAVAVGPDRRWTLTATVAEAHDRAAAVLDAMWKGHLLMGALQLALQTAGAPLPERLEVKLLTPDGRCEPSPMRTGRYRLVAPPRSSGRDPAAAAMALAVRATQLRLEVDTIAVFQLGGTALRLVARTGDAAGLCARASDAIAALFPSEEAAGGWYLSVSDGDADPALVGARATVTGFGATRVRPGVETDLRLGAVSLPPPPGSR
jgi:hypothetical protein